LSPNSDKSSARWRPQPATRSYLRAYDANNWAAVKAYLAAVTDAAAAPVIAKYAGLLGAADVFTTSNTFAILESIRLDLAYNIWIHP